MNLFIVMIAVSVSVVMLIKAINAKHDRYAEDIKLIKNTVESMAIHLGSTEAERTTLEEKAIAHYIIEKAFEKNS